MGKIYTALGLMSGTSMDGVDASIIKSDGIDEYSMIFNKYFKYSDELFKKMSKLKDKIFSLKSLETYLEELKDTEREITIFHAEIVKNLIKETKEQIDLVGFHGQTIFHDPSIKTTKQLGDGNLLSKLTKTTVVFNFRENDIKNGGEGAPLAPIFHKLLVRKNKIELPVCILNIGGISNVTLIGEYDENNFLSRDLGPGNCLIDAWVRKNNKGSYDENGAFAKQGKTNNLMLNQALDNFDNRPDKNRLSFDTNDFDISFLKGINFEDGAATLTDLSGRIIGAGLFTLLNKVSNKLCKVLVSGGGRKNQTLIERIKSRTLKNLIIQPIDDYNIDGDFVESQAFAYLAIRSYLKLPISFPETTGCKKACTGGVIVKNF